MCVSTIIIRVEFFSCILGSSRNNGLGRHNINTYKEEGVIMSKRIIVCLLALMLAISFSVAAQQSNTNAATGTLFTETVDNAFSVTNFSGVGSSFFFASANTTDLSLAYGGRFGDIFLGIYYGGNLFGKVGSAGGSNAFGVTSVATTYGLDANNTIVSTETTTTINDQFTDSSNNTVKALFGIGTIGFGLSVAQKAEVVSGRLNPLYAGFSAGTTTFNTASVSNAVTNDTVTVVKNSAGTAISETATNYSQGKKTTTNYVTPGLTVGATLNLGGVTLKPSLGATIKIDSSADEAMKTTYTKAIGSGNPTYENITEVLNYNQSAVTVSNSLFELGVAPSVVLVAPVDKLILVGGLIYNLTLPIYSASYTDLAGAKQTVAGSAWSYAEKDYSYQGGSSTAKNTLAYGITETSSMTNKFTPLFVAISPVNEVLTMALSVVPVVTLSNTTTTVSGKAIQTTVYKQDPAVAVPASDYTKVETKTYSGDKTVTDTFDLSPYVTAGFEYFLIPKVLRLNAAASVTLEKLATSTKTVTQPGITTDESTQTFGDGTVTKTYASTIAAQRTETLTQSFQLSNTTLGVSMGATWFLTEDVSLDMLFLSPGAGGANYVDVSQLKLQLVMKMK